MTAADPRAALVIIGAEVLSGKVQDANSPYLVRALRARGVDVIEIRTIPDDVEVVARTIAELVRTVDFVLTTGGIGPTHDDVTIAGIARAFGVPVVRDAVIETRLRTRIGADLNQAHLKMADVPEGAQVILDDEAFVPIVQMHNVTIFPGVPALMRWCFDRVAADFSGPPFFTHALLLAAPESSFAVELAAIQRSHREVSIGSYPRFEQRASAKERADTEIEPPRPRFQVKVTVDGRDRYKVRDAVAAIRTAIPPSWIVGEDAPPSTLSEQEREQPGGAPPSPHDAPRRPRSQTPRPSSHK